MEIEGNGSAFIERPACGARSPRGDRAQGGFPGMFARDIGIDLGTANVLVFQKGRGVVIQAPSVVAVDTAHNRILAVGDEARRMLGRTPGDIVAIRPLRDGVIADYDVTEAMLKYFVSRVCRQPRLFRPQ